MNHSVPLGRRPLRLTLLSLALCGLTAAPALADKGPAPELPKAKTKYSVADFLENIEYQGASFSPDDRKLLVSNNSTGIFNAYLVPIDGSAQTPLTRSDKDSIFGVSFFPKDERILYTADQGGNELNHVFVRELDGSARDLTPGEKVKANFLGFARDDRSFFIATNERDPRYFDVYEYQVADYRREMIFENNQGLVFLDISPDRKTLAFNKAESNGDSDIYFYNREEKALVLMTPGDQEVLNVGQEFSVDGKSFYYLSNEGSEFSYLLKIDLVTQARIRLVEPSWDVVFCQSSKSGRYLAVGINNDSRTELRLYEAATMKAVELPQFPDSEINALSFSNDEKSIALYASSSKAPGDLFVHALGATSPPRQLSRSLNPNIDPADLVDGKVVRFRSFDDLDVPGILYSPKGSAKGGALHPALIWVHGGPGGQSRLGYNPLIQALVHNGYVVYAINNRGSSGYGKTFFHLDDRKHGQGDLQDCVTSKKMLSETGYVDPERIGIIGGSYGGYMVLAALAFTPKEFAVGINIFGVANWLRTLQSIPPWWEAGRKSLEKEFGSFSDEAHLRAISPLFHAKQIERPLMVLQGANDPRVLKVESDDIVAAAKTNGVEVEYLVFGDEGHGFLKKENRQKGYQAILDFLDRLLKKKAT